MAPHRSSDLIEEKRALRRAMGERREGLSAQDRRARAGAAAGRLLGLPELAAVMAGPSPGTICGYVAMRAEIDPAAVLEAARAAGAVVALPRVSAAAPRLRFHRADAGAPLRHGPHGLREPDAGDPEVPVERIDAMIVPGLAFDGHGHRLGYGGGYYDEAGGRLRASGQGLLIGLAYDFQVVALCPADDRDVTMDVVVTEERVLRRPAGGGA